MVDERYDYYLRLVAIGQQIRFSLCVLCFLILVASMFTRSSVLRVEQGQETSAQERIEEVLQFG